MRTTSNNDPDLFINDVSKAYEGLRMRISVSPAGYMLITGKNIEITFRGNTSRKKNHRERHKKIHCKHDLDFLTWVQKIVF